jgi:tripartite-type tricarboxylate transporter receptor subunit TctC
MSATTISRFLASLLLLLIPASQALAQKFPEKAIRLIVPFQPGGPIDLMTRLLANDINGTLGQPVIVENRPGASGGIAADSVVRAEPDGYTLLMIGNNSTVLAVGQNNPYSIRDITPIAQVGNAQHVLVVTTKLPVNTLSEFLELAKSQPGKLNFASPGVGTTPHLATEWLKQVTGIDMVHVAYRGEALTMSDFLNGRVHLGFFINLKPLVETGAARPIAVAAPNGSKLFPELPSVAQSGLPAFGFEGFLGIAGPARMRPEVVNRLNEAVMTALAKESFVKRMHEIGYTNPGNNTPAMFVQRVSEDVARWKAVIAENNLSLD